MITRITAENEGLYTKRFQEVTELLKEKTDVLKEGDSVDTLQDYFGYIGDIVKQEPRYIQLPLDEETFDIDLNSRKIKVPQSFAGGLGVQNDHLSEFIYFIVDRYYDAWDLNPKSENNTKILIQWKNAKNEEGISRPVVVDCDSKAEDNKIIFGWALSDEITKYNGNIQFSVRFYALGQDGQLSYNLNTLTATAKINSGLNLPLDGTTILDYSDLIKERTVNISNDFSKVKPVKPEFTHKPNNYYDFDVDSEGNQADYATIMVSGFSGDTGIISSRWTYGDDNINIPAVETTYLPTADLQYKKYHVYYRLKDKENLDEPNEYELLAAGVNYQIEDIIIGTVYEKFTYICANKIGKYKVQISNRLKSAIAYSDEIETIIKGAEIPVAQLNVDRYIIGKTKPVQVIFNNTEQTPDYLKQERKSFSQFGDEAREIINDTGLVIDREGNWTIIAQNTRNGDSKEIELQLRATIPPEKPELVEGFKEEDPAQELAAINGTRTIEVKVKDDATHDFRKYQWYYKNEGQMKVLGETEPTESNSIYLNNAATGTYYVKVWNVYNEEETEPVRSVLFNIS